MTSRGRVEWLLCVTCASYNRFGGTGGQQDTQPRRRSTATHTKNVLHQDSSTINNISMEGTDTQNQHQNHPKTVNITSLLIDHQSIHRPSLPHPIQPRHPSQCTQTTEFNYHQILPYALQVDLLRGYTNHPISRFNPQASLEIHRRGQNLELDLGRT